MSNKKKKVLMYYSFENKIGGPLVYLQSIINSDLKEEYEFATCFQNEAAGGMNLRLIKRMVAKIKTEAPDIVHVHGLQSEGFYGVVAAKLAGCRCIVTTVHGFAFDGQKNHGWKWFLYRHLVEPITLRLSDQVYCVCQYTAEREIIKKNVSADRCSCIHNAVGNLVIEQTREKLRSRWNITEDETVFVIAGRVTKDKGFDILGRAVKRLSHSGSNKFRLLVVGNGDYIEPFCEEMSEEIKSGLVIMIGQTEHVADYLGAADVFILPSYHENLPIALLEAGKMGLACIASDAGGIPEVIRNGENGFLVRDAQPDSYAERMESLIKDSSLRRAMGSAIKEEIDDRFSLSIMCERIKEVYENGICGNHVTK